MRVSDTWFSLVSSVCFFTICTCKSGFILTSPKVLNAGSTEHFTLVLFDVLANGTALLSLRSKENDEIFAQRLLLTSNGYKRIAMEIPHIKDSEAWIQINGTFLGINETSLKKLVKIRHKSVITSVQTDKPIYNPGQIEPFRVLPLDIQLKPLKKDTFTLRYNVPFTTESEVFDLKVTSSRDGSYTCRRLTIGICIRYKIPEQTSNMVVVTVKMISGYVPGRLSIRKLYEDNALALKWYNVDGSDIHFYFTELTNEQKCFRFLIRKQFEVEDVKLATVKLYDCYQTEWEITKHYGIPPTCISSTRP